MKKIGLVLVYAFVICIMGLAFARFVDAKQPQITYHNGETPAATAAQWSSYLLRKQL